MEIAPILRALARNRIRCTLIAVEVALTLAIVLNCLNMTLKTRSDMGRATGIDEPNLIAVRSQPFAPDFRVKEYLDNTRKADLLLLRSIPGVRAAESITQFPLSGSGSSSGYKPLGSEARPWRRPTSPWAPPRSRLSACTSSRGGSSRPQIPTMRIRKT